MIRWFKLALGLGFLTGLLFAPITNAVPTSAQTKAIDPIFDVSIAQLHLQLKEVELEEQIELEVPEPLPIEAVDCSVSKCIALTFDDGPSLHTIGILKSLHKAGAKATFFALGLQLREHPHIAREILLQGHELGGHSYAHQKLQFLSRAELERDFSYVSKLMFQATGERPAMFRPPYGEFDSLVQDVANAPVILWSVDPKDWLTKDPNETYERVVSRVQPGDIVVMHDILGSTRHALPKILKTLGQRGYKFVTVSELLGELEPGQIYRSAADGKK